MNKDEKEAIIYVIGAVIFFVIFFGIAFTFKFLQVKWFYGGDMRCLFADCRINK